MYDNEFETIANKIETKDKIEPQHIHNYDGLLLIYSFVCSSNA